MTKTLQIREVPKETHAKLSARAAANGQSLSQYLLDLLNVVTSRPTIEEALANAEKRPINLSNEAVVDAVRSGRDRK